MITLEQMNIYSFLGYENDPLYIQIKKLKQNEKIKVDEFVITKNNFGLFEVESEQIHLQADTVDAIYKKILGEL